MGFLEGLFHPQEEVADTAHAQNNAGSSIEAVPGPDITDAKEQGGASEASITPTHMDMAGSGPATVDLSGVAVSPVESTDAGVIDQAAISAIEDNIDASSKKMSGASDIGESVDEGSESAGESTDGGTSDRTDESVEPVLPGEFSTAVTVDTGAESQPVTEPDQIDPDEEQSVGVSTAGAGAALDQLAQWQVSDAVGNSEANSGERTDTQPDTNSVAGHDEPNKPTSSNDEAITTPLEDVPQTNKEPDKSEGAEDFAKKLNVAASLEADEMDARKAAMEAADSNDLLTPVAATLDTTPKDPQSDIEDSIIKNSGKDNGTEELTNTHTVDGVAAEDIKPDQPEDAPTDELSADSTLQDTSFPELKVESDTDPLSVESPTVESEPVKVNSVSEAVEPATVEADGDDHDAESLTVGGADVHTDRTEYLTSEEKPDLAGGDVEKNHPERLVISLEDRRTLEAAKRVIEDLLDKAA